jgi:uncharacterized membrane protein YfcA
LEREKWFPPKLKWLARFAAAAVIGVFAGAAASFYSSTAAFLLIFATVAPFIFWLCFIPIMHWRERYRGTKPYTWGAFLVFETSGWSKIFYWFMHVLPDRERRGLYRDVP